MVTPATPDTADSIGATTDDSKGGLFTSGSSTALVTIQGVISELVTDAQTIETNVEAIETRINDFGLAGLKVFLIMNFYNMTVVLVNGLIKHLQKLAL